MEWENRGPAPIENPYASPTSFSLPRSVEESDDRELQELGTVVGAKADYYLERWRPMRQNPYANPGMNWAAFLFSGLWFPYRKMYRATLILYGVLLIEAVMENVIFIGLLGHTEAPRHLNTFAILIVALTCGGFANRWYLVHCQRIVTEVRAEAGAGGDDILPQLAARGGTNLIASIACYAAFIATAILSAALLAFVGGTG